MKKTTIKLTTAQFANLHKVNKRTLHYYDNIGLFSPNTKGENGYRYYDLSQSLDFEYILMLRDLNMSIEEIEEYTKNRTPEKFMNLANAEEFKIDNQIKRLKYIKKAIQTKKKQIELSSTLKEETIEIIKCKEEKLLFLPYDFCDDDISSTFSYMKDFWSTEQIRMGVGGLISVEKILANDFSKYDGIYTSALRDVPAKHIFHKPQGDYLCYYHKGKWETLPFAYQKITSYAKANNLKLTGYAYETGLNEFAITKEEDYITKIVLKVEKLT